MKKLLLKSMLLLCALVVGSLNGWAQSPLWSENFSSYSANDVPSGGTYSYSCTNGAGTSAGTTKVMNENTGGGTAPELMVGKKGSGTGAAGGSFTAVVPLDKVEGAITLKYKQNANGLKVTMTAGAVSNDQTRSNKAEQTLTLSGITTSMTSVTIVFEATTTNNVRLDDIVLTSSSVESPTILPAAGAVNAGSTITITQASADEIRYTLDGTDPTKNTGTVYSDPITINTATTIKAIAIIGDNVSDVASASYTINVTAPTFNKSTGTYSIGTMITITSAGNTIYYTTNGDTPTESSTEYTAPIELIESITIKAIAVDGYGNKSAVKSVTYTLPLPGQVDITPNYEFFGKAAQFSGTTYDKVTGTTTEGITVTFSGNTGNIYASSTAMRVYPSNTIKIDAPEGKVITKIVYTQSNETEDNMTSSPNTYTTTTHTWTGNASSVTFTRSSGSSYLQFTKISVVLASKVSITSAQYATFCDDIARDFSASGITVYAATASATSVAFDEVTDGVVPANTGVVLYSASVLNDVAIPATTKTATYDFSANEMVGVNSQTTIALDGGSGKTNYILANGGSGVGFYKAAVGGAKLAAHKAYLSTATASASRDFLGFNEGTTGVNEVKTQKVDGEYYNLAGQRVAQPTKGLYIVNGKKVIMK